MPHATETPGRPVANSDLASSLSLLLNGGVPSANGPVGAPGLAQEGMRQRFPVQPPSTRVTSGVQKACGKHQHLEISAGAGARLLLMLAASLARATVSVYRRSYPALRCAKRDGKRDATVCS
jgi:hypothetical protein